jgi:glycosyltransferase involved in cell wall biosynthesis
MIPAIIAGLRLIRRYNVEHILSSAPYWTNHLIGFVLARSTGLPWTAHFRDPWADDPQPGRSLVARLHSALESMVVRAATTVVCVTDMHTDVLRRVYSVEHPRKFVTIPNGYDGAEWDAVMTSSVETRRATNASFVITYAGTLYMKRSPLPVFRALRALIDAGDIAREHLRIELLGDCGVANGRRVAEMAAECGIEDAVYITGRMSRRDALRRIAQSDLLLLLAEDLTLQIPGKTYEYLRAGRPILALTSRGAVADLLRRIDGAAVIDPTDARHITAFLRQAYRDWRDGREARHPEPAVVAGFDRRVLAGRFADLFAHPAARVNG